ncbi:3-keto-5-aminohexanoate cleavage enzyme [Frankia sp. Hr75.2]|nr:3-keto-5-aminohexanoate cleavage enzyme [Frankia sp. Hr75.2]
MLKACLNGIRRPDSHPALPVTPDQLAAAAAAAGEAGAAAVHLHVKDEVGADTFDGDRLAAALEAVRAAVPKMPIGVSTAASAVSNSVNRVDAIDSWTLLPDFASVNWHEPGTDAVADALLARGVGVEAGLWHRKAIRAWQDSPLRNQCIRVLIELGDLPDSATTEARADQLLEAAGLRPGGRTLEGIPVLLHGKESSAWPALQYAVARGLDTRIGLEDTLLLPNGNPAPGNTALVEAARALGAL